MQYGEFADYYDRLMKPDINYEYLADYIENLFHLYDKNPSLVADLACGTGNVTIPMAKRGYEMIGVDLSEDMLSIAREKAFEQDTDILFLNQNLAKLDLYGTCDAFICMIDGFNYIIEPKKIEYIFKRIKTCFLNPGGIFIFDISTRHKLKNIVGNNTFVYDNDDLFYVWENKYFEKQAISRMYLNFFAKDKNGTYRRFSEEHIQRGHSEKEITSALTKAGFEKVDIYGEMSFEKPLQNAERVIFVAT